MNILSKPLIEENIAEFFNVIGQPVRIRMLLVIGHQEACVCHLEAFVGLRQAAISQHLMALRKAGILVTRREGRNIFYRIKNPKILDLIDQAADYLEISKEQIQVLENEPVTACPCPFCNPGRTDGMDCSHLNVLS